MIGNKKHVFFLGIGGIGMSAVARYFFLSGHRVSGYDRDETALTKKLEAMGIDIRYSLQKSDVLEYPVDLLVYTPAIKPHQSEFQYFAGRNVEMMKRSEVLQMILKEKKVIAIAGTHGKTTISALLAHILHYSEFGATAFVGGIMNNYDSNFLFGNGPWVIVEADEYDRSFWRLYPQIAVVQAIDADHLDIYETEEKMVEAYRVFTLQINKGGQLFVSGNASKRLSQDWIMDLKKREIEIAEFGLCKDADIKVEILDKNGEQTFFVENEQVEFQMQLGGAHNIMNASAAIAVARYLGVKDNIIAESLSFFKGIERRFSYVLEDEESIIIEDYAHHPKEIDAAISAARIRHKGRKLTVVFQPHLYTRTKDFMVDFANSLAAADELILVELYPAREEPIEGIDSHALLKLVDMKEKYFVPKRELVENLKLNKRELILLLGAGDVYKLNKEIKDVYTI